MKTLFKILTSKAVLLILLFSVQLLIFGWSITLLGEKIPYFYSIMGIIAIIFTVYIISADINPAYKITWIIPILLLPIFGLSAYFLFGRKKLSKRKKKRYKRATEGMDELLTQSQNIIDSLQERDTFFYRLSKYIYKDSRFPVHCGKDTEFLESGEKYYERLLKELKTAQKYIFLEFFIIDHGQMWESILGILKEKAAAGVDVRIIYDDVGTILRLPHSYINTLRNYGIKVFLFNRFKFFIDAQLNNRTHRKIVVIDNKIAFTGGVNLADEYINLKQPFGHWKDNGIIIKGSGVKNFTMMFLQLWALEYGREDYQKYQIECENYGEDCFVIPFSDSPLDNKNVYKNILLKIIYNAREYIFINTPYLILDSELKTALSTAARSGIDVRITVPHTPDKKFVFALTKAFYTELIDEGVKIYEYLPGFMHAKSVVSDGKYAVVGTSNLDFRSFYLHLECGTVLLSERVAAAMTKDYLDTCLISRHMTKDMTKTGIFYRLMQTILRVFSPML